MSQAASSQPLPRARAAPIASREVRTIAPLVGGVLVLGFVGQAFAPPGPWTVLLSAAGASAALVAAGLVLRGRLLDALGSFRLAATALAALSAAAALGTVILQGKSPATYHEKYGSLAGVLLALRLDDVFHSLWFGGLLALTIAGITVSAVRRWPIRLRNAGFFACHTGLILTLLGAGLSATQSVKGKVDLRVGARPVGEVAVTRDGVRTGETIPLPAALRLDKFDVDHYRKQYRLSVYRPKGQGWELKSSWEAEPGVSRRLADGSTFRVKGYFPDLVWTDKVVPVPSEGAPALKVAVDGRESWLIAGEKSRVDSADGKVSVLFGYKRPSPAASAPMHALALAGEKPRAVTLGETVELGGAAVKVVRFFPHFVYDIETKTPGNLDDKPDNPALEVELSERGGPPARRWLFAHMPGYAHGKDGPDLTYTYSAEGGATAQIVVAVAASDRTVVVHEGGGRREEAFREGLEVAGVKLLALLAQAKHAREPGTASQEVRRPAVLVETVVDGQSREALLEAGRPDALEVGGGLMLAYEGRGDDVKSFRSTVTVVGREPRQELIAVNSPMRLGDWSLYQVNYDPKDPSYSGLEAVRDPGLVPVFAGFGLIFAGVLYVIYVQPRIRRKEI